MHSERSQEKVIQGKKQKKAAAHSENYGEQGVCNGRRSFKTWRRCKDKVVKGSMRAEKL